MDRIGKYEVLDKIGSGGFAVVYKGYDPYIKRPVAIKVCYSREEETRQRFFREAEIAGRLVHRHITTVYDFGLHEQMPYLVEEYLSGEDLANLIRRQEPGSVDEKIEFLLQIASGLEYAHSQGVIHRDIKPSNVRVLDNGRLKIMDFGTAKLANVDSHLTQTGMTLGTVAYLSPERLLGRSCDLNSDIFSYGVLAYELLSFERPFRGRNIPHLIDQVLNATPAPLVEVWGDCPEALAAVVDRCLLKDPQERYISCTEMIADLEEVRDQRTATFVGLAPLPGNASSTAAELQVSTLLARARQVLEEGRYDRAEMLLDEVMELAPGHPEAAQLATSCAAGKASSQTSEPSSNTRVDWESPEQRHQRKINEAVASIDAYMARRELGQAASALRFATQLLGRFDQIAGLRDRMAEILRQDVAELRQAGRRQARQAIDILTAMARDGSLPPAAARPVVATAEDLDLASRRQGRQLLATLASNSQQQHREAASVDEQARKRAEAVASIENFLAQGNPELAGRALRFALEMFEDFAEARQLEERIAEAQRGHEN